MRSVGQITHVGKQVAGAGGEAAARTQLYCMCAFLVFVNTTVYYVVKTTYMGLE